MYHDLQCKRFGLFKIRHNNVVYEWGALCDSALTPSATDHKPFINYGGRRTVTGATEAELEKEDIERHKEE